MKIEDILTLLMWKKVCTIFNVPVASSCDTWSDMKREDTHKKGRRYRGVIKTIVNQYRKHVIKRYTVLFMFL